MRILLVQSYLGQLGVADQLVFPIGLACVATALEEAGHEPWIVDLNVGDEDPHQRLRRELERFEPDAVGVSLRNIDSTTRKAPVVFHTVLRQTLATVRAWRADVPTLLGGAGFTQGAASFMERYDFDFGLHGEAEQSVVELLAKLDTPQQVAGLWYRQDGRLEFTGPAPMPPFGEMPFPKRHHLDWDLYHRAQREQGFELDIGVEASRGCPGKCAYCNYPQLNGVHVRARDPEVVVDELFYLRDELGIKTFCFTDSRFNLHWDRTQAICEQMIARGLNMPWKAWLGLRDVTPERLALMRDAGCVQVGFCPDALHQPSLDRLRKNVRTEQIGETIEAVHRTPGMRATWSFFCVPPGSTRAEQLGLLRTYMRIHVGLRGRGRMFLTWCRVEENTHFETIAREDGFLREGMDLLPDDPAQLAPLFHVPPGMEHWSAFWERFLDVERLGVNALRRAKGRAALGSSKQRPRKRA